MVFGMVPMESPQEVAELGFEPRSVSLQTLFLTAGETSMLLLSRLRKVPG